MYILGDIILMEACAFLTWLKVTLVKIVFSDEQLYMALSYAMLTQTPFVLMSSGKTVISIRK